MGNKTFQAWEQVRNWCQSNPGKKAAVATPKGTFTVTWRPTEAVDVSAPFPHKVFSPLRGSEPGGSTSPHYEHDPCGCTHLSEVRIGDVLFQRRLVRRCDKHQAEAAADLIARVKRKRE